MKFNTEEINQLIRKRRSVFQRDYSGVKVNEDIIRQMLENANWAPNHKMTEPWRFVVFTGDGIKRLAEFQAACYKEVTMKTDSFKEDRYQGLLTKPMLSSHIIAVGMKRDERKSPPEIEELGAVYCAVENMYLTATAYGVGCYLSSGGITYFEEAKEFFGLGKEDKLLGFLHVGVPKGEIPDGRRRPIEEKVKWINS
ncbi:MAG: nitroreductase [Cyclobacteriaceae bacterium]|nr:nitroreductase [Cyclobacteriaceae bacterium]